MSLPEPALAGTLGRASFPAACRNHRQIICLFHDLFMEGDVRLTRLVTGVVRWRGQDHRPQFRLDRGVINGQSDAGDNQSADKDDGRSSDNGVLVGRTFRQ